MFGYVCLCLHPSILLYSNSLLATGIPFIRGFSCGVGAGGRVAGGGGGGGGGVGGGLTRPFQKFGSMVATHQT